MRLFIAAASAALGLIQSAPCLAVPQVLGTWQHAFSEYGEIKYPKGFDHFDYVNPNAPKGGTLSLSNPDRRTSYDKLNMFTLPQNAPAGVELFVFESLCEWSADEGGVMYGLVAKEMLVAPDFSTVTFRIDERARFNNGDPVTVEDVKYSFDTESSDFAGPFYSLYFVGVKDAVVLDSRTIRFDLKEPSRDQVYLLGTRLKVISLKWAPGPDGKPLPFNQIVMQEPITTGPYKILKTGGHSLELARRPDYWARDLGVRRGFYNFDRIIYHYYVDNAARFEAFKAGDFEILKEYRPSRWMRLYKGDKFGPGKIIKSRVKDGMGFYFEGWLFNTRRPIFHDPRVREALILAFDWGWASRQGFDMDGRFEGMFQNSPFQASGSPSPEELALMEPLRKYIPAEAFGPKQPLPPSDTPAQLRANLLKARALLAEAGWTIGEDGKLRNAAGEDFHFEIVDAELEFAPIAGRWIAALNKLGITVDERLVDFAIYEKRIEAFDLDVTLWNYGGFLIPGAATLNDYVSSHAAAAVGSDNVMGVANPAIDAMLDGMSHAQTIEQLQTATRVMDRVFWAGYYGVPYIYRPAQMMAYWDHFGIPEHYPKFFSVEDGLDAIPWPMSTWWSKSAH